MNKGSGYGFLRGTCRKIGTWFGHVTRSSNNRLTKQGVHGPSEWEGRQMMTSKNQARLGE